MEKNIKRVIYFSFGEKKAKIVSADHVFLSNFYLCSFVEDGKEYKSVEHYFQSKKYIDEDLAEQVRNCDSPLAAKRLGRDFEIDIDWWQSIKEEVMKRGVELKFSQNPELREKLLMTDEAELREYSRRDKFWGGSCKGSANKLGIILMNLRQQLKNSENQKIIEKNQKINIKAK